MTQSAIFLGWQDGNGEGFCQLIAHEESGQSGSGVMMPTEAEMGLDVQDIRMKSQGHSRMEKANFRGVLGYCNYIILLNLFQQTFEVDIIIPIVQMKILKSNLELYLDFRTLPNSA